MPNRWMGRATPEATAIHADACQFFYECQGCGELLRSEQCDCCVFCSFGSAPCPPIQAEREAGNTGGGCCR